MSDLEPPDRLKSLIATSLNSTVYASVGVSIGAILSLVAPYFGGHPWSWFFVGMCIPPGPMYMFFTSDWMFRRRLHNLKRLLDEGLISQEMYEQDRQRAMEWRRERLYGKSPELPKSPKPTPRKRTKPAITSQPDEASSLPAPQAEDQPEAQPEAT